MTNSTIVNSLQIKTIALLGNPNAGKSSLFNALTGLQQKVGNYAGVTIDKNTGVCTFPNGKSLEICDLPGIYSLFAKSPDERVVLEALLNPNSLEKPDLVVVVLDASNLNRSLLLLDQIREFDFPIVVALNMLDVAASRGVRLDVEALQAQLKIQVVPINARLQQGLPELQQAILDTPAISNSQNLRLEDLWEHELIGKISLKNSLHAKLLISQYSHLNFLTTAEKTLLGSIKQKHQLNLLTIQTQDSQERLKKINTLTKNFLSTPTNNSTTTDRLDSFLLHPLGGYIAFFFLLLLVFQAIFNLASYPMDWIDASFSSLSTWLGNSLPDSLLSDLFVDGIVAGIGGIVIFVPQIAILFTLIAILEETGYMARVMFLTDKTMSRFGLNGKSVVPLISGAACAVPAIMATRSISSWKERLITIMVTPLISCSARLPVYIIFITLVVPTTHVLGIFSLQSLTLAALYFGGFAAALLSALVFNKLLKTDPNTHSYFVMELPSYKLPQWRSIGIMVYQKTSDFVLGAGKIIIAISIILWVLATYGPPQAMEQATVEATQLYAQQPELAENLEELVAAKKLEASFIGHIGHFIEPVIRPLGYDWKIGIALITSFAAREVFVSTMATIYSVGDADGMEESLLQKIKTERNPHTGALVFNTAVSFSLLVFYLFAMQCMATLAIVQRETKSWKWPMIQLVYMTALAYVGAFITYQLLS